MAAWPASLPDASTVDGYSYRPVPQTIHTGMDSGPPKVRRRWSVAYGKHPMAFVLTDAQRATFETFYTTTMAGGSDTITGLTNPYTNSTATFQIAEEGHPQWTPLNGSGTASQRKWRLVLVLEQVV